MLERPKQLDGEDMQAVMAVFRESFASHPMLPPGTPAETTEKLMALMLNAFGRHDRATLQGIQRDGTLACVALTLPNGLEPRGLALVQFILRLCLVLGWRLLRDFTRAMSSQPKYDQPYLDLMLLGTLPDHQGHGLGRTMLRAVCAMAESQDYCGVTLAVAKNTPAYKFYRREGFIDVAEVPMRSLILCHMRRDNGPLRNHERCGDAEQGQGETPSKSAPEGVSSEASHA